MSSAGGSQALCFIGCGYTCGDPKDYNLVECATCHALAHLGTQEREERGLPVGATARAATRMLGRRRPGQRVPAEASAAAAAGVAGGELAG